MKLDVKKILLAGTALVAVSLSVSLQAHAADDALVPAAGTTTVEDNDTWNIDAGQGATTADIVYNDPDSGATLTVTSAGGAQTTANIGTLDVTTNNGTHTLTVGNGAQSVTLVVNGAVTSSGTTTPANDLNIVVDADEGTGAAGKATTIDFKSGVALDTGSMTLDDDANGGTATVSFSGASAQTVQAAIKGAANGEGAIVITNSSAGGVTFSKDIGGGGNAVATISLGTGAQEATFDGAVNAKSITIDVAGGKLDFNGNVTVTDGIDMNQAGTVELSGATLLTGDVDFNGKAGTVSIEDGGDMTGNVISTGGPSGTVTFLGDSTFTGSIGTSGTNGVSTLNLSSVIAKTAAISGDVHATTVNMNSKGNTTIGGTLTTTDLIVTDNSTLVVGGLMTGNISMDASTAAVTLNGGLVGDVDFSNNGTVTIGAGKNLTGTVDNDSGANNKGTLAFAGTSTVSGAIGTTNTLAKVSVGTGTVTFQNSKFGVQELEFSGAGTADLTAVTTVSSAIDFQNNAGTVNFGDGVTYSGTATSTSGGKGTLVFAGNATISGSIGAASGTDLANVIFNGGAGKTATLTQNLFADAVTINGAGTVTSTQNVNAAVTFAEDGVLNIAASRNVTSLDSDADGQGTVNFGGASTISGAIGATNALKAINLNGSGTTVTVTGNIRAADATTIGTNTLKTSGTFTAAADQTLNFTIGSATTAGTIISSGIATIDANTLVNVSVGTNDYIANNTKFTLIDGTGGSGIADLAAGKLSVQNSALVTYTQDTANNEDLVIVATRAATSTVAVGENNQAVGDMLDDLGGGGNADVDAFQARLAAAQTGSEVNELLDSLTPDVSGGAIRAALNVAQHTSNIADTRLATLRAGEAGTGIATGNDMPTAGVKFWTQGFGGTSEQDNRDGVEGYDADTVGVAFGVDADVTELLTLGLALSYSETDVDAKDANATSTQVDSYQAALYGEYNFNRRTYLNGQLGYIFNDNETMRYNVGGVSGNTATGDFHGNQYIARSELGSAVYASENMVLTPSLLFNYNYIDMDSYDETGAGGLSLTNVETDDIQIFELGVGLKSEWNIETTGGSLIQPNIHAGYRYDFIGDKVATTSSLAGGGAAFLTQGADPAQGTLNLGTGVTYITNCDWEFVANYDFEQKEDYTGHAGYLRAAYKF